MVNGSPTKTQMVVGAGGRSQVAQLAAVVVVGVVCAVATGLLGGLPLAALAAVVFLIGVELVDVAGMRRILAVRRAEFVVAVLTALAVVVLGVEEGIVVAVVVSIIDHLRHSYAPRSSVLVKSPAGHWRSLPVAPGTRTAEGLLVYRFGSGLYFANVSRLVADLVTIGAEGPPVRWLCLDAAAIGDVDYTAAAVPHPARAARAAGGCAGGAVQRGRRRARRAGPLRHHGADRRGRHLRHLRRGARGVRGARLAQTAVPFCHCAHDSSQSP